MGIRPLPGPQLVAKCSSPYISEVSVDAGPPLETPGVGVGEIYSRVKPWRMVLREKHDEGDNTKESVVGN